MIAYHCRALIPGLLECLHFAIGQVFFPRAPETVNKGKVCHFHPGLHQIHRIRMSGCLTQGHVPGQKRRISFPEHDVERPLERDDLWREVKFLRKDDLRQNDLGRHGRIGRKCRNVMQAFSEMEGDGTIG